MLKPSVTHEADNEGGVELLGAGDMLFFKSNGSALVGAGGATFGSGPQLKREAGGGVGDTDFFKCIGGWWNFPPFARR